MFKRSFKKLMLTAIFLTGFCAISADDKADKKKPEGKKKVFAGLFVFSLISAIAYFVYKNYKRPNAAPNLAGNQDVADFGKFKAALTDVWGFSQAESAEAASLIKKHGSTSSQFQSYMDKKKQEKADEKIAKQLQNGNGNQRPSKPKHRPNGQTDEQVAIALQFDEVGTQWHN